MKEISPVIDPFQKYIIAMVTFVPLFWIDPWYQALYSKLTFMAKELTEVDMLGLGIYYPEIVWLQIWNSDILPYERYEAQ